MSEEFKPINTQEEFNAAIADRIKRAEEAAVKPYADYEDLKKKAETYEQTISGLNAKIKEYEDSKAADGNQLQELQNKVKNYETRAVKVKIAHEVGIPYDLADRLAGETEDDIRKDAEAVAKYMTKPAEAPLGDPEPTAAANDEDAALMKVVAALEK